MDKSRDVKQRAYEFSLAIIKLVNSFPEKRVYWVFGDQLLRSATSIGANLIEGSASSSRREFIKFYEISLKSANETVYWLNLIRDAKLTGTFAVSGLITEAQELCRMIASSLITLKGRRN